MPELLKAALLPPGMPGLLSSLARGAFQTGPIPKLHMGKLRHGNKPGDMGKLRVSCSPALPAVVADVPAWE